MAADRDSSPLVVAAVRDLFFGLRIANTLRQHGYQVRTVSTSAQLRAALDTGSVDLLVIDLACVACDAIDTIAALKSSSATSSVPILAFGPHIDRAARDAAKAAGADRVVANSKLHDDLVPLVARYIARDATIDSGKAHGAPERL